MVKLLWKNVLNRKPPEKIDIFLGYDILCIKINISDPSPLNFNRGSGCLMARIQESWLLWIWGVC